MEEVILALEDMISLGTAARQGDLYYAPGRTKHP
jgi:hypothetical protein